MEKIVGRLTANAETKQWNDRFVINFSVAENRKYRDATGEWKDKTRFFECSYWMKSPKLADYLTKGKVVEVDGTIGANAYIKDKGKKTAEAVANLTIDVYDLQLHSPYKTAQNEDQQG